MQCVVNLEKLFVLTEGVFIALGSNVGDREQNARHAIAMLGDEPEISIIQQSKMIETQPVGPIEQGLFINVVIEITTTLSPSALLAICLVIEEKLGRVRAERWGPRTIDLDIILFGSKVLKEPHLTIPHPELLKRSFVLCPLLGIAPDVVHPVFRQQISDLSKDQA
ncbi:MAG: 2-amino-4-hydroxy-6-hydroxymethyldihydropteridine diphosphokinase [Planctomycetes bacterium]|nr:2-amino-4-hydroxy-6-hydroxymethyldihydropteridine diphosphokinase [Planctomycetota bacterium]